MVALGLESILTIIAVAVVTAGLSLAAAARITQRQHRRAMAASILAENAASVAFLFDDELLVDATPAAHSFLATSPGDGSDWSRLAALLRFRFPSMDRALGRLAELGRIELDGAGSETGRLLAEWREGFARIVIAVPHAGDAEAVSADATRAEKQSIAAMEAELETLRTIVRAGPVAIWKQGSDSTVVWANDAYFALAEDLLGTREAHSWPPPSLFPLAAAGVATAGASLAPVRVPLRSPDGRRTLWFECHGYALGPENLCFALSADNLVRAEESLREFVQTLSKTFADLPIGLAIFDRDRRLALFNPALIDLTTLPVDLLAGRPTLFAFLDALRDRRRIPEQRDYRSWRQKMAALEAAAADGFVQESWTLPAGQTYRVTGRPHPDGAVAFLFEDISAEISLTRRFRAELELGQTVLDSLGEAIAVFSPNGLLTFWNAAYAELWGIDPATTLAEIGIVDATRLWQCRCAPTPIWGDTRDFVAETGERADWSATVMLRDGHALDCRFQPLPGGATLVGFSLGLDTGARQPAEAGGADAMV